ncbi:S8 family peptidase [Ferrimonas balearica]|uniref:S8 family peptidase n=1 Tax=Ferrimonas balearica TaxID=44012 RepID=UPI001C997A31|nr:S8 family peptidase [Ferrimonas balearica]MBY5992894.1 S8 family serine peptidase [Ferrimonas balearica]
MKQPTLKAACLGGLLICSTAPGWAVERPNENAAARAALPGQGPATRFIVHYADAGLASSPAVAGLMNAQQKSRKMQEVTDNLGRNLGQSLKYLRALGVPQRYVMASDRALDRQDAEETMALMMANDPNILAIEVDQLLRPMATPNDPRYSDQWHYFEATAGMNLPAAWDNATGAGTVVAVLDTGYRPHADLVGNILPGYDMIDDTFVSVDGDGRDNDAQDPGDAMSQGECGGGYPPSDYDSSWHGTHVAGTVAAVGNNNLGVTGVAYDAKVVPVRVLGKCGGYTSDIADGIIWASGGNVSGVPGNANPANVINLSLGGSGSCSSTTQAAINTARANGATVVVAAGNSDADASGYNPANCSGVITVAALGRDGTRAYYSNYGNTVDISAPGGAQSFASDPNGVLSTHNSGTLSPGSDNYDYLQGTSMAAPHVAGLAALLYEADPTLTPDQVESLLKNTARADNCSNCGVGLVDSDAAVTAAINGDTGGGGGDGTTDTYENLDGARRSWQYFTVEVPAGASSLTVSLAGGTGDADLYVRFGSQPDRRNYDCRPYLSGNNESCSGTNPNAGTWHIGVYGYRAFSGATLTVTVD